MGYQRLEPVDGRRPAIIALSRWYPLKKRGTYYGFFSASHNLGEAISFVFVGLVVGLAGWKWGFVGSAIAGAMGVAVILLFLHDTPESKGLPPVEVLSGEAGDETEVERESVGTAQKAAFRNPYIWILALASACMYVSRYAINGWGVIFLQEVKGFPLATATQVISVNAFLGIAGTVFSGWMSDKWFNGSRYSIAVTFGVLCSVSLGLFLYSGSGMFVNILAMVLFGIAIGVLICFVGGLMAVDLVRAGPAAQRSGSSGSPAMWVRGFRTSSAAPCSTSTKPSSMASRHTITASHRYSGSPHRFCHSCW